MERELINQQPSSWGELFKIGKSKKFKIYYVDLNANLSIIQTNEYAWLQDGEIRWIDDCLHEHHETIPYYLTCTDVMHNTHDGIIVGLNEETVKNELIKYLRHTRQEADYALKKLDKPKHFPNIDRKALWKTIGVMFGLMGLITGICCAPQEVMQYVLGTLFLIGIIVLIGGMVYSEFKERS